MRSMMVAAAATMLGPVPAAMAQQATARIALAAESDDVMPEPPGGAATGFAPPERDEAGYRTPNRDLIEAQAVWHVRVALNVAALGCRASGDEPVDEAYNSWLTARQLPLAAAVAATRARYTVSAGAAGERRFEDDMTRLYNFFAQPPAHARFCAVAAAVLRDAAAVPDEGFAAFARAALPRLEAPFVAFYAAYDDYRGALANWRDRHAPVVLATAAAPPVGPVLAATMPVAVPGAIRVAMRGPAGPDGD